MDGRKNMSKYDKMIALNKETSLEKITLARNTILEMVEEGVILKEKILALQRENETLKSENKRLKQMAERKAMNNFKKL